MILVPQTSGTSWTEISKKEPPLSLDTRGMGENRNADPVGPKEEPLGPRTGVAGEDNQAGPMVKSVCRAWLRACTLTHSPGVARKQGSGASWPASDWPDSCWSVCLVPHSS